MFYGKGGGKPGIFQNSAKAKKPLAFKNKI